jgi:hypothetical protein
MTEEHLASDNIDTLTMLTLLLYIERMRGLRHHVYSIRISSGHRKLLQLELRRSKMRRAFHTVSAKTDMYGVPVMYKTDQK